MANYDIELYLDILTEDPEEQHIGMERIKFFFSECVADTIFISQDNCEKINQLINTGFKISTLPYEPYDQTVAYALLHKLNAITEGRYQITDIIFGSDMSYGVKYIIDYEEESGEFSEKNNWWHSTNTNMCDIKKIKKTDKIVKLTKFNSDWSEVNLNWKNGLPKTKAEIVFTIDSDKN
jgi:hypothetical protein